MPIKFNFPNLLTPKRDKHPYQDSSLPQHPRIKQKIYENKRNDHQLKKLSIF